MAFKLDANGLTVQTLDEIKLEMEQSYRDAFGNDVNLAAASPFGQIIGIHSEREAKVQQTAQSVFTSYDPNTAPGVNLDRVGSLTGSDRQGALPSTAAGLAKGTDGVVIPNGKIVRLIQTQTQWQIVGGPYTIGSTTPGEVAVEIESVDLGPIVALTGGPAAWEIVTAIVNWDTFETTADADVGRDVESDAAFRVRRDAELLSRGCDVDAIRANVLAVEGVTLVKVFENRTLVTDGDGLPGKAIEVLVEGGDDEAIADAIFDVRPPGVLAHGVEGPFARLTDSGDTVAISFTRPLEIAIWISIDATATGAEDALPVDFVALNDAAILAFGNANHNTGDDVIPQFFVGTVYDTAGNKSLVDVTVKLSTVSFGAAAETVIAIGSRRRADFDSVRVETNVL